MFSKVFILNLNSQSYKYGESNEKKNEHSGLQKKKIEVCKKFAKNTYVPKSPRSRLIKIKHTFNNCSVPFNLQNVNTDDSKGISENKREIIIKNDSTKPISTHYSLTLDETQE